MKSLRNAVVIASALTLVASVAASASTPAWQAARRATLPGGARGIPLGFLPALSCPTIGNCVAGGSYTNANYDVEGLVITETHGHWANPIALRPPSKSAKNPGVTTYALSCGATNYCSAAGGYVTRSTATEAFVADDVAGVWQRAQEITLPANAIGSGQVAQIRSMDCPSRGNCSATGTYLANAKNIAHNDGFVVDEVHGTWQRARTISITTRTNVNPFVDTYQLDCSSTGNCVAVGSFVDSSDVTQGLLVDEVNGTWRAGVELTLPPTASAYAGASANEVTCVSGVSCAIFGTFTDQAGNAQGLSASETHGDWSGAVALTMPSNASPNPHVFLYDFDGIACASAGNCALGGQYEDATGNYQGFLDNEVAGTWQPATELMLPSGAGSAGKNGGVVAVSCPSVGNCRASGAYLDGNGEYQGLVADEESGTWDTATMVILPSDSSTVGIDGGVYALVCNTTSSCTGTGTYLTKAVIYDGFTLAS